jgi:hypothetical protein
MTSVIVYAIIFVAMWLAFMVFVMPIIALILGLNVDKVDGMIERKRRKRNDK